MSALKADKYLDENVGKFLHNIKKLKLITKKVSEFDQLTAIKILETHQELLETYWKHCTAAHLEAGNDIPFDDNVFWWQTNGDLQYQTSSDRLKELLICCKVIMLTKTHIFASFHRVTYQIFRFDDTTMIPLLEFSVELLEQYWFQFSEAYSDIVKGSIVPILVSNVYVETETYYINAKLKLKSILHYHSKISIIPQMAESSIVQQIVENYDDLKADFIVESIDQMMHKPDANTDDSNEKSDDLTTTSNEGIQLINHYENKSYNFLFTTLFRFIDWVRLLWRKRHTSEAKTS